jgi:pyrimidine-nucleoside phosphorylase
MRAVDIIEKKRDGRDLSTDEIEFFIRGFTTGDIPDYQASAWAMAVLLRGMNSRETADLTMAMARSGDQIDLSGAVDTVVDKHSTGGVGDKTTLVVEPIVSACGVPVGKMSGRGLSFTGGTLDKMESIAGYNINLTTEAFIEQLKRIGLVLAGQTAELAPADGKLYALRDVTGTVPSIPLIASSIMSKKISAGAQAIVLDVKVGLGAFMQTIGEAEDLAKMMVGIGRHAGRQVVALLSDMNQPLGKAVGNALEVIEAIETLQGEGPDDFRRHAIEVAGHMLVLAGHADDLPTAKQQAVEALESGRGLEKFRQLVEAQGGDVTMVDHPERLPATPVVEEVPAPRAGYIQEINAHEVGLTVVELGGGREEKGDPIDHAVGVVVEHNVGDRVDPGQVLFTLHANDEEQADTARRRLLSAHKIVDEPVDPLPLFYGTFPEHTGGVA